MSRDFKRFGLGAALLTVCLWLTGRAFYEHKVVDAAIYMTITMLAVAISYSISEYL